MKRHHLVGHSPEGWPVFVTVNAADGRLSITGVEGPKPNGDARGSCGQCIDAVRRCTPTEEFSPHRDRLVDVWERWHLNDMHAGCEHQRAEGWKDRPIDPTKPTNTYGRHCGDSGPMTWNMLVWVSSKEHPSGLLSAPCPTCGYRYGTAWLREDVPQDVLDFLASLPTSDDLPTMWQQ